MKKTPVFWLLFLSSTFCSAQNWASLGLGLQNFGSPSCMYTDTVSGLLYVGGQFNTVDGNPVRGIASWNGSAWNSLGDGLDSFPLSPSLPGYPRGMVRWGNYLYVCGGFIRVGEISSRYLARWDGTTWDTIPGGQPNNIVSDLLVFNNELYACGTFDSIGNIAANGVAKWDGFAWSQVGNYSFNTDSTSGVLDRIEFYHGKLYVAGNFEDTAGLTCNFAVWDGTNWQFLNSVFSNHSIWDMIVYNDELYVSGSFNTTWGNPGNCIERWNDTTWRDVGGSVDWLNVDRMTDMEIHNNKIYCSGNFQSVGGIPASGLASWDGTNWCGYATLFEINSQNAVTYNLSFLNDTLYVGGAFWSANGIPANAIAQWIGGSFVDTCGNTTGMFDHSIMSAAIEVFPNPSNSNISFRFDGPTTSREIFITDNLGREIVSEQSSDPEHTLSVESFAAGVYFYSIVEDGEIKANGKLVIVH